MDPLVSVANKRFTLRLSPLDATLRKNTGWCPPIQPENRQTPASSYTLLSGGALLEFPKSTLLIVSALFPIVNPLGGSPVFLALTREYPASARRILARQVARSEERRVGKEGRS